jgi:hypothetical protein
MRPLPLEIDPFLIASVQGNSAHSEEDVDVFHPIPEFLVYSAANNPIALLLCPGSRFLV